ncbi:MAG: hypothetical protein IKO78_04375 [Bacilli bacterium]|nr:hypothetical protein [Bacilli bacterium]
MEIKLRNSKSKNIEVKNKIISLQETNNLVYKHLIEDYNPVVVDNKNLYFVSDTVLDELTLINKYPELEVLGNILKLFGYTNEFFDKNIKDLSTTEKICLNILRNVEKAKDIIVFNNLFLGLDLNSQKALVRIINYLCEINYIVIIRSDDVNVLYKCADYSILATKTIIKYDETDKIYTDVKYLMKHKFDVPTLSYITYKAKEEKNVRLFYRKDVRDIIKDIYKHV